MTVCSEGYDISARRTKGFILAYLSVMVHLHRTTPGPIPIKCVQNQYKFASFSVSSSVNAPLERCMSMYTESCLQWAKKKIFTTHQISVSVFLWIETHLKSSQCHDSKISGLDIDTWCIVESKSCPFCSCVIWLLMFKIRRGISYRKHRSVQCRTATFL